jgi:hypothetical protein
MVNFFAYSNLALVAILNLAAILILFFNFFVEFFFGP